MDNTAPNALIDSHCHLDLSAFDHDRDAVVQQAVSQGVQKIHVPGTTAARWSNLLALQCHDEIDVSLGLHPYFLNDVDETSLEQSLLQLARLVDAHDDSVVAVGECGLDGAIDVDMSLQQRIFEAQITIAKSCQKPLILHGHKSHHLVHQSLQKTRFEQGGIIHAFSGSEQLAQQYIDRGFLLGIGGTITYPRAKKTIAALAAVGLEHIVLETDSPDMPLSGFQGQRNTPEQVVKVAFAVANILGTSIENVQQKTTENYLRLFA